MLSESSLSLVMQTPFSVGKPILDVAKLHQFFKWINQDLST